MVPEGNAMHWANSDEASQLDEQENKSEFPVRLLIEKDFVYLIVREGEDDSDAFV